MTSPKLTRTFELLKLLSTSPEPVPLKKIGEQLQLESSMLSRIITDLIALGMVEKTNYRTVTVSPELVQLGLGALNVLPATQCLRNILKTADLPANISVALAAVISGQLFFFLRSGRAEAFPEPLGRSGLAAMIAAHTPDFPFCLIPQNDLPLFRERVEEAKAKARLSREHAGRFRELVFPVSWNNRPCAIGFLSENQDVDMDKLFICGSRITAKLRSAGE